MTSLHLPTLPPTGASSADDPLWYKDAVIYELRVGAYQDSDDDD